MNQDYSQLDIEMSRRAMELAAGGIGRVSPSPLVGCVILDAKNKIAGEGTYVYDDVTHAEVIALEEAGKKSRGGTAYVSLEPHSHQGRTEPCTAALINAGIKRVVVPIEDPNPLVSGKGFKVLRESGVEVVTGLLEREAKRQNEKFIHWHANSRPFVHLKMAVSLDGRIATRTGDSRGITGAETHTRVHQLRHEYDVILVGSNTALVDNPSLTDRSGNERRRQLVRVVLDNSLKLPPNSNLALTAKDFPTILFTDNDDESRLQPLSKNGVEIIRISEGGRNLQGVLNELAKRELTSVLVEGGADVAGSFYDAELIDKVSFFIAPLIIGGKDAPTAIAGQGAQVLASAMRLADTEITHHGADIEVTGYPR